MFVMETMVDRVKLEKVRYKCGFQNGLCLDSHGLSGGIGFWWDNIDVHIRSYSRHHVFADILDNTGSTSWHVVGIYRWPEQQNKVLTCTLIRSLMDCATSPIIFFRDFNMILASNEKEGGAIRFRREIEDFRNVVDNCALKDLGFMGSKYTWQRCETRGNVIGERLDRFLSSMDWYDLFPDSVVDHLPIYLSDHALIFLHPMERELRNRGKKRFCFETFWIDNPDCENIIKEAWCKSDDVDVVRKVKICGRQLLAWASKEFGSRR